MRDYKGGKAVPATKVAGMEGATGMGMRASTSPPRYKLLDLTFKVKQAVKRQA
jgi:hypothetical protein